MNTAERRRRWWAAGNVAGIEQTGRRSIPACCDGRPASNGRESGVRGTQQRDEGAGGQPGLSPASSRLADERVALGELRTVERERVGEEREWGEGNSEGLTLDAYNSLHAGIFF